MTQLFALLLLLLSLPNAGHNATGQNATGKKCHGQNATGQNATPENATRTKCHPGSERPDKMPLSYFA